MVVTLKLLVGRTSEVGGCGKVPSYPPGTRNRLAECNQFALIVTLCLHLSIYTAWNGSSVGEETDEVGAQWGGIYGEVTVYAGGFGFIHWVIGTFIPNSLLNDRFAGLKKKF